MTELKNQTKTQKMNLTNGSLKSKEASEERISALQSYDASDPLKSVVALIEKKARNLEKRKARNLQLKQMLDEGKELNDDQRNSAMRVSEVIANIELLKEFSSMISNLRSDHHACVTSKPETKCAPNETTNGDLVKQILEFQNNFKKYHECCEMFSCMKLSDEKVLKPQENEKLLKFIKLVSSSSNAPENSTRLKKITQSFIYLLSGEKRLINQDLGITYEQMLDITKKIPFTILQCKLAADAERKKAVETKDDTAVSSHVNKEVVLPEEKPVVVTEPTSISVVPAHVAPVESSDGWLRISRGTPTDRKVDSSHKGRGKNNKRRGVDGVKEVELTKLESVEVPKSANANVVVLDITRTDRPRYREKRVMYNGENNKAAEEYKEDRTNGEHVADKQNEHSKQYTRRSYHRVENTVAAESADGRRPYHFRRGGDNRVDNEKIGDSNAESRMEERKFERRVDFRGNRDVNGSYRNYNRRGDRSAYNGRSNIKPDSATFQLGSEHIEATV